MTKLNNFFAEQKNVIARALFKVSFSLDISISQLAQIIQLDSFATQALKNDPASTLNQDQCYRALLIISIYEKLYLKYQGDIQQIRDFFFEIQNSNGLTLFQMCESKQGLEQVYTQIKTT